MSIRGKTLIKLFVRIAVTVGLLVWVFSQIDFGQFRQTVQATRWHYLVGVWLSAAAFFWVQSLAMRRVLLRQSCDVSTAKLFSASCVTMLYSLVLPGILSAGVKWYILKRYTGKGSQVLSSMVYNQVALSGVMVLIGLAGLVLTNPTPILFPNAEQQWILPAVCATLLVFIVLMFALLLNGRTSGMMSRFLGGLLKPLPGRWQEKGRQVLGEIGLFRTAGPRFHLTIIGINVFNGLWVGLLMYLFAARAARVDVSIGVLIWLCAIVFVLSKVPISLANLGVREATLVWLLAGYGVSKAPALLMSMALLSAVLFMAGIGAVYQLRWLWRRPEETIERGVDT